MIKAGWLRRDFPSQIWEALIVSDPVQSLGGGGDFLSQIWEIWTGLDTIKAGWLRGDFPSQIWET